MAAKGEGRPRLVSIQPSLLTAASLQDDVQSIVLPTSPFVRSQIFMYRSYPDE